MIISRLTNRKRRRRIFTRSVPGAAPGTVTLDPTAPPPPVTVTVYGPDHLEEIEIKSPSAARDHIGAWPVMWVNVDGLGNGSTLRGLGELFDVHRLALEDVANVPQRAKVEEYDKHLFIVMRMLRHDEGCVTEQVSLFLGKGFVLTFQERPGDCFEPVRERIRHGRGRIRHAGADYLAYALIDAVIDHYFPAIEHYGDRLEDMEQRVLDDNDPGLIEEIHKVKKELLVLRRAIWPTREAVNTLLRDSTRWITDETRTYLRDCYDHTIQVIDMLENQREIASSLTDMYMTTLSNRMNEIMKVLAIIATIFIPLSFIAGLYGMNFDQDSPWNLPELSWYYGYPIALTVMAAIGVGQVVFFWRKGWIGSRRSGKRGPG